MDIRSSLDGLRSLLGVTQQDSAGSTSRANAQTGVTAPGSDRATVSSAGSEVSQSAATDGVRMEKVAAVKAALESGSYEVPALAVASKIVDAMLSRS